MMSVSRDGGHKWSAETPVAGPVNQPGVVDPVLGRPTIDGIAGARSDLAPAPSVDIANGAPTGAGATNRIVMSYVSGPLATPHVYFTESSNQGATWTAPRAVETAGDRGYYAAPAISPDGTDVYIVYNAFTRRTRRRQRLLAGWSASCSTQTRRLHLALPPGRSLKCIVATLEILEAAARTTWSVSSSGTMSMRRPPTTTRWRSGTTAGTGRTARPSMPGASPSETGQACRRRRLSRSAPQPSGTPTSSAPQSLTPVN